MTSFFNDLLVLAVSHLATLAATTLSLLAAAVFANFRGQINAGTKWALSPVVRRLPWHRIHPAEGSTLPCDTSLSSELTVIDVFLDTTDGKSARYQKTANYTVVGDSLHSYQEGITASGAISNFSSLVGTIIETTQEHGFYISRIDLADILGNGFQFQNIFSADLQDCFTTADEHCTQEIARPTKHLTFRIHFPAGRPPKLVRCKVVEGVSSRQIKTDARITELSGAQGIVWDIQNPKLNNIYKLEWAW